MYALCETPIGVEILEGFSLIAGTPNSFVGTAEQTIGADREAFFVGVWPAESGGSSSSSVMVTSELFKAAVSAVDLASSIVIVDELSIEATSLLSLAERPVFEHGGHLEISATSGWYAWPDIPIRLYVDAAVSTEIFSTIYRQAPAACVGESLFSVGTGYTRLKSGKLILPSELNVTLSSIVERYSGTNLHADFKLDCSSVLHALNSKVTMRGIVSLSISGHQFFNGGARLSVPVADKETPKIIIGA